LQTVAGQTSDGARAPRRWGGEAALLDDAEARRRLLVAASACIVRRGSARIRMSEVADEAGVARSTLYRYFRTREELIIGLILSKVDAALDLVVSQLPHPRDAARSLPDLVLMPLAFIDGNPVNEALFSPDSRYFVASLELSSEPLFAASFRHLGPLLQRWQSAGQLHADLDLEDLVRWISVVSVSLLSPPWSERSEQQKRDLLLRLLVRAVVTPTCW
jgi:TetR/AcrR family transcriptional regulator